MIQHTSPSIHHLSFVICHLSFAVCRLSPAQTRPWREWYTRMCVSAEGRHGVDRLWLEAGEGQAIRLVCREVVFGFGRDDQGKHL